MWKVYLLKSAKAKWFYIGSTNRLNERIAEHNSGKVRSTKAHTPLRLVHTIDFSSEKDARAYEQWLKSKRIEKEALIRHIEE